MERANLSLLNSEDCPAMSNVEKEEANDASSAVWKSTDLEFFKLVKPEEEEEEEDSPLLVAGLIKQEAMTNEPPEIELGIDYEASACDLNLKKETFEEAHEGTKEVDDDNCKGDYNGLPPAAEDVGTEFINESGEGVKEDPSDVSGGRNEEEKRATSSEVTGIKHIDGGAPPGWEAAAAPAKVEGDTVATELLEVTQLEGGLGVDRVLTGSDGEGNDDEPPPSWEATVVSKGGESVPPLLDESMLLECKTEEVQPTKGKLEAPCIEKDDDDERPPPGLEMMVCKDEEEQFPHASVASISLKIETEEVLQAPKDAFAAPCIENDDDCERPPPGWEADVNKNGGESVPHVSVESIMLEVKTEGVQLTNDRTAAPNLKKGDEDDGPPPGWEAAAMKDTRSEEALERQENAKEKQEHIPPQHTLPCNAPSPTIEMSQLVCGSCRSLLSYPKGAKYVQCLCCQNVSFVLEAHQVGQVYCGGCAVLLMYKFGSPAVKCSGCKFITQITPHNRRPPLSEQGVTLQSQLALLCPRPTTNLAQ